VRTGTGVGTTHEKGCSKAIQSVTVTFDDRAPEAGFDANARNEMVTGIGAGGCAIDGVATGWVRNGLGTSVTQWELGGWLVADWAQLDGLGADWASGGVVDIRSADMAHARHSHR